MKDNKIKPSILPGFMELLPSEQVIFEDIVKKIRKVYGMKLIFCIDDKSGMMFFEKRQSQDQNLREWILNYAQGSKLWMSPYSAKQFGNNASVLADDDYMVKAEENDVCFIEDGSYSTDNANEIVLCKWNRHYPADKFFDTDLKASGFKKVKTEDIAGTSHEKITIETYRR